MFVFVCFCGADEKIDDQLPGNLGQFCFFVIFASLILCLTFDIIINIIDNESMLSFAVISNDQTPDTLGRGLHPLGSLSAQLMTRRSPATNNNSNF